MSLTKNILDAAGTGLEQSLDVQQRATTSVAVAMRISFYLSCDIKKCLWLNLMGMKTRGPNLPFLIQRGPFTSPCPWDLSQLNVPAV